jgi:hypothetical protein
MHNQTLRNENNPTFFYCFDDAVEVIFQNISNQIRFKYTWEDISLILEIKDEYYDLCCQQLDDNIVCDFPIEINEDEMRSFIILHASLNDLKLPEEDLNEILDAELVYFEQNGAISDAGEYLN